MRQILALWAAAFFAASAPVAHAGDAVVVELFTSQGCSSCPPADKFLGELVDEDDVIPLALHVDYWDYIGWKDIFADPAHTKRQRGYARAAGQRSIYTPELVIGGQEHVIGLKPMKIVNLIQKHRSTPDAVDLKVRRSGDTIQIEATAKTAVSGDIVVQVVEYVGARQVDVRRGENAGRTLVYHNVVSELSEIGRWNGSGTFTATDDVAGAEYVAVIVQRAGQGPILAAAKVR